MPYLILFVAAALFFLGGAAVFALSALALAPALASRRRLPVLVALAGLVISAAPALFTFAYLSTVAWPGRFEPVPAQEFVCTFQVEDASAHVRLDGAGTYLLSEHGWRSLPRAGAWSWHPAGDWQQASDAGRVHLESGGEVVLVLHAQRDGGLLVERMALADSLDFDRDYLPMWCQ